jgi:CopG family nickel-responsive transcriptional regulator
MNGVRRFSASVTPELLESFDKAIAEIGYDRSKAIGLAMNNFLSEYAWEDRQKGKGAGALSLIYDHDRKQVDKELTEIQHHHRQVIISTTHVHLDQSNCLLIIAVRGDMSSIRELTREISRVRGVLQARMASLAF